MDQERPTTQKSSNKVGFVLIAAAAGAIAGLLFAPKRGTETREDLKGKYNGMKNKSKDAAETAHEKMNQGVDTLRSKVHTASDKSKDIVDIAADKTKDAAQRATDEAKKSADQAAEHAKRDRTII